VPGAFTSAAKRVGPYTDGLTEARTPDGEMFTIERLVPVHRTRGGGGPDRARDAASAAPRLIGREAAALRDDATAVLLEWHGDGETALLPQTA